MTSAGVSHVTQLIPDPAQDHVQPSVTAPVFTEESRMRDDSVNISGFGVYKDTSVLFLALKIRTSDP